MYMQTKKYLKKSKKIMFNGSNCDRNKINGHLISFEWDLYLPF